MNIQITYAPCIASIDILHGLVMVIITLDYLWQYIVNPKIISIYLAAST